MIHTSSSKKHINVHETLGIVNITLCDQNAFFSEFVSHFLFLYHLFYGFINKRNDINLLGCKENELHL